MQAAGAGQPAVAASDARAAHAEADMQAHAGDVGDWLGLDASVPGQGQVIHTPPSTAVTCSV